MKNQRHDKSETWHLYEKLFFSACKPMQTSEKKFRGRLFKSSCTPKNSLKESSDTFLHLWLSAKWLFELCEVTCHTLPLSPQFILVWILPFTLAVFPLLQCLHQYRAQNQCPAPFPEKCTHTQENEIVICSEIACGRHSEELYWLSDKSPTQPCLVLTILLHNSTLTQSLV